MKKSLLSVALLAVLSLGLTSCMEISPTYLEGGTSWIVDGSTSESGEDKEDEAGENSPEHTEHTYDEGKVTKEATCTEDGEKTYTCTECGDTYTEKIDATGEHQPGSEYFHDETSHWQICTICNQKVNEVSHTMTSVVTEPTCTEKGFTTMTCECGYSYVDENSYVEATGEHTYVVGTLTWQSDDFYNKVMCSVCGQTLGEVDSSGNDTDDNGHCPHTEAYLAPSNDEYTGTPRSSKSEYGIIGSITNYGETDVQVSLDVDPITRIFFGACNCDCDTTCGVLGYYDYFERNQTCPRTDECSFCRTILGYEATIDEHFDLDYAYATVSTSSNITLDDNEIGLTGVEHNEAFTVGAGETLYIYASFIWISDIEGCVGTDADTFDTFIGNNWSDIQFGIIFNLAE